MIGGASPDSLDHAVALYGKFIEKVIPVSSTDTAEMVKLLENTFRAVNIGLVNEVAIMCGRLGLDTWEVIEAAATKPFGFMPFYPGPGLGGHCIPIDPLYLSWKLKTLKYNARFIALADEINSAMPELVVTKIADALNDRGKAVRGAQASWWRGSPTRRTSTTPGSRRRWTSSSCWKPGGPRSPTTTSTCLRRTWSTRA